MRTAEQKVKKAAYMREYYAANAAAICRKSKDWVLANTARSTEYQAKYHAAHVASRRAKAKAWAAANPERKSAAARAAYEADKERRLEVCRAWKKANPDKVLASNHARSRRVRQATPSWADMPAIRAMYLEAQHRGLEVDHVIPLNGKLVSGLHVHQNLQLLSAGANRRKGNRHAC